MFRWVYAPQKVLSAHIFTGMSLSVAGKCCLIVVADGNCSTAPSRFRPPITLMRVCLVSTWRMRNFMRAQSNKSAIKKSMWICTTTHPSIGYLRHRWWHLFRFPTRFSTRTLETAMKFISTSFHLIFSFGNQLSFLHLPTGPFQWFSFAFTMRLANRFASFYQNWICSVWVISFAPIVAQHFVPAEVAQKFRELRRKWSKSKMGKMQSGKNLSSCCCSFCCFSSGVCGWWVGVVWLG